jgi:diacylglycerol diphosphate phosphatase/phosphatidate phosphatase
VSSLPNNNPLHNIHAGVCTLLVAIGISEFVTQTIKFYVGRLRPNFYSMCGFDKQSFDCTNGEEMEMEARMSFPSGHSSLSFCGAVCLVLFFVGRLGLGRPLVSSVKRKTLTVLSFAPLLLSSWCATSRLVGKGEGITLCCNYFMMSWASTCLWFPAHSYQITAKDNWHHPSDIIAGSILGSVAALVSYHIW